MSKPPVSSIVHPANTVLWAVKSYLDLINRGSDRLQYGDGLKRLFVMNSGISVHSQDDVVALVAKAERDNLIPQNLDGFLQDCVLKNCLLYGKTVAEILMARIVSIANGDVRNPDPLYKYSAVEARRYFYLPPVPFLIRAKTALREDFGSPMFQNGRPATVTLQDIAHDADSLLGRMQLDEGHIAPSETSWGNLVSIIEGLVTALEDEARYQIPDRNYLNRSRPALKILWFLAKLLLGDLTINPQRKDLNAVDLESTLWFTDGTLAAMPFPLMTTISLFEDMGQTRLSFKGRIYLSAVSAAAFYRTDPVDQA